MSTSKLEKQRVLVTGATNGIGRETVLELVRRDAIVIAHGRDGAKLEALVEEARAVGGQLETVVADLASLEQTAALAAQIASRGGVDVLVNNAGVGFGSDRHLRETTRDGIELRFGVNYVAPFVLSYTLLDRDALKRAVVNVASVGQAPLDLDDLGSTRGYDGVLAYRRSKLALVMLTLDLAESHPELGCVAVHPGTFLDTGMVRESGITPRGSARRGAEAVCFVAERAVARATGRYFDQEREAEPLREAFDASRRRRLREATLDLTRGVGARAEPRRERAEEPPTSAETHPR